MPEQPNQPLDVRNIHQLVRMMKKYDLTAIDFVEGETKIRLRRRGPETVTYAAPPQVLAAAPQAAVPPVAIAAAQPAAVAPSTDSVIESPMVGTYYASSAPDAPPFVSVGTTLNSATTVCVIEAMKVFTDIPAGLSGTVTEVLVKNGQPVEFGQPMFRVRPS
jgi:acetyl-CoA carboxylase biotin carboxyl carrier protein